MRSHIVRVAIGLLLVASLAACGEEPVAPAPEHPGPAISITQVSPEGQRLAIGDSLQMSARVIVPRDLKIVRIDWDVSDTSLASVSASGMVLARKSGTFGVRARMYTADGYGAQGAASVHID